MHGRPTRRERKRCGPLLPAHLEGNSGGSAARSRRLYSSCRGAGRECGEKRGQGKNAVPGRAGATSDPEGGGQRRRTGPTAPPAGTGVRRWRPPPGCTVKQRGGLLKMSAAAPASCGSTASPPHPDFRPRDPKSSLGGSPDGGCDRQTANKLCCGSDFTTGEESLISRSSCRPVQSGSTRSVIESPFRQISRVAARSCCTK